MELNHRPQGFPYGALRSFSELLPHEIRNRKYYITLCSDFHLATTFSSLRGIVLYYASEVPCNVICSAALSTPSRFFIFA